MRKITQLVDLRRRAIQQSRFGNYWATKCLALLDDNIERQRRLDMILQRCQAEQEFFANNDEAATLIGDIVDICVGHDNS